MPIPIFCEEGSTLLFAPTGTCELPRLATQSDWDFADKDESFFRSLAPGCCIRLQDGCFLLDDELDLISARELEWMR